MVALAIAAGVIALPQMLYLSTGPSRAVMPRLLSLGLYGWTSQRLRMLQKYLGFTFGFQVAVNSVSTGSRYRPQRRIFVAVSSLLLVAFSFQFTIEVFANQKFFTFGSSSPICLLPMRYGVCGASHWAETTLPES